MTTTPSAAVRPPGVAGIGVYFEFTNANSDRIAQVLLTPELIGSKGNIIPPGVLSRIVSPEHPTRSWRVHQSEKYTSVAKVKDGKFTTVKTTEADYVATAAEYFASIYDPIDTMLHQTWKPVDRPLLIQISDLETTHLEKKMTPRTLFDRLRRLRSAEGFAPLPGRSAV